MKRGGDGSTSDVEALVAVRRRRFYEQRTRWEYFDSMCDGGGWPVGGWKPCTECIDTFLEEQSLLGVETCQLTSSADDEKYEWNFVDLTEKRQRRRILYRAESPLGQWTTVRGRSIRRVMVLMAPNRPADWFPLPEEPVPADWAPAPPVCGGLIQNQRRLLQPPSALRGSQPLSDVGVAW